jgi:hypothetical protein
VVRLELTTANSQSWNSTIKLHTAGASRIRTYEETNREIYNLLPLTTQQSPLEIAGIEPAIPVSKTGALTTWRYLFLPPTGFEPVLMP